MFHKRLQETEDHNSIPNSNQGLEMLPLALAKILLIIYIRIFKLFLVFLNYVQSKDFWGHSIFTIFQLQCFVALALPVRVVRPVGTGNA
jgi:hypothetical protein